MRRRNPRIKKTVVNAAWLARAEHRAALESDPDETLLFRFARLAATLDAELEIRRVAMNAIMAACEPHAPKDSAAWSWNIDVRLPGAK